jgi:predicted enzyme related to lactoylglutathione lyase
VAPGYDPRVDVRIRTIVIDCADPPTLAPFWSAVTGYREEYGDDEWVSLADPAGEGVRIGLQRVPEPKSVKNRVHIDLWAADEEASAARIQALGATRLWVSKDPQDVFIVLADPEGNEFCVVRDA